MSKCAKECAEPTELTQGIFSSLKTQDLIIFSDDMRAAITEKFNPVHMEVDDLGTCGTSYQVIIVSVSMFR